MTRLEMALTAIPIQTCQNRKSKYLPTVALSCEGYAVQNANIHWTEMEMGTLDERGRLEEERGWGCRGVNSWDRKRWI